jgi:membrane-associated phospholipid phosphatase
LFQTSVTMANLSRSLPRTPHFKEKLLWALFLMVVFGFLYSGAQRVDWRPVTWLEVDSRVEGLVPVNFSAIWPYLSLYGLLLLATLWITERRIVHRFGIGLAWLGVVSCFFFLLFPTGVSRPDSAGSPAAYQWMVTMDAPRNAFPSLHASLAVLAAIICQYQCRNCSWSRWLRTFIWAWVALIFWSCLALRQHTEIDLIGGGILGWATGWLALEAPTRDGDGEQLPEPA